MLKLSVWFIEQSRWLAPARLRDTWCEAWLAELCHRAEALEAEGALGRAEQVDLARRSHLVIREEERVETGWFGRESREKDYSFETTGKSAADLQSFEKELLSFTLGQIGDGRRFRMSGLKETARRNPSKFRRWLVAWRAEVQREATCSRASPWQCSARCRGAPCRSRRSS